MAGNHFKIVSASWVDFTHIDAVFAGVPAYVLASFSAIGNSTPWSIDGGLTITGVAAVADPLTIRMTTNAAMTPTQVYNLSGASSPGNEPSALPVVASMSANSVPFTAPASPAFFHAISAVFFDTTHIDVTFDYPLVSIGAAAAYVVHGPDGPTNVAVSAIASISSTKVRLTVAPIVNGPLYTVHVIPGADAPTVTSSTYVDSTVSFGSSFNIGRVSAARENVVRVQFSTPVYFSMILDAFDAFRTEFFAITPVAGTVGLDGVDVRPVNVIETRLTDAEEIVSLPQIGGHTNVYGEVMDLVLDRPMSSAPARYTLTVDKTKLHSAALDPFDTSATGVFTFDALFKLLLAPTFTPTRSRDMANPMTREAMFDPLPNPDTALNLGTMVIDDTGDYGFDEGLTAYKKRCLRRVMSRKNGFAHLIGYGVGVPQQGKKLMQTSVLQSIIDDAEKQIQQEPETAKVKVRIIPSPSVPGLVHLNIVAKTKTGHFAKIDVPLVVT